MTDPLLWTVAGLGLTFTTAGGAYGVHLIRRLTHRLKTVTAELADAQETARDLATISGQQTDFLAFLENERRIDAERIDALESQVQELISNQLSEWAAAAPVAGD